MSKNEEDVHLEQEGVQLEFGKQLRKYREATGLTILEYSKFIKMGFTYLDNVELGKTSIGIRNMEKIAVSFGVRYFQMGNPSHTVPMLHEMPLEIQTIVKEILRTRDDKAEEKNDQKSRGDVDKLWSAKKIHELLAKGFFKEPHTSKEVFLKLNPAIKDKEEIKKYSIEIGKITASLSKGKFAVLLEKLPPLEGESSVRFVEKGSRTTDM